MGLTVHWQLKYQGTDLEVLTKLAMLSAIAPKFGFKIARYPWRVNYAKSFEDEAESLRNVNRVDLESYRWAKIQSENRGTYTDSQFIPDPNYNKYQGWISHLWAGNGCEPTNIGLISLDGTNWIGHGFTKTQYAEEFVKCHLRVITILDACKELGILKSVHDEGEYWETRKIEVLGENINGSTAMIMGLAKVLQGSWKMDNVQSAVDDCKNFVSVNGEIKQPKEEKRCPTKTKKATNRLKST